MMALCQGLSNTSITRNWSFPDPEDDSSPSVRITTLIFLILFVVIAMPCSILVIGNVVKNRLFKQPTIVLYLNLLITTMLLCIIHIIPFPIVTSIAGEFIYGNTDFIRCIVCSIDGAILVCLFIAIAWSVVLISLDRLIYLCKPLSYPSIVTIKRIGVAISFVWIHSVAFSVPPLFGFGSFFLPGKLWPICFPNSLMTNEDGLDEFSNYFLLLTLGLAIPVALFGIIVNVLILCIICRNLHKNHRRIKTTSNTTNASQNNIHHYKQQFLLFQIFGALFIINILIYIPVFLYAIVIYITGSDSLEFGTLLHIALSSQGVMHPLVQALFIKDIRTFIKKICCFPKDLMTEIFPKAKYCGCGCFEACKVAMVMRQQSESQVTEEFEIP